jgi:hypothetical protein
MKKFFATFLALGALALAQKPNTAVTGYTDTPEIPGQKWRVHDATRPKPVVVTPGAKLGDPPSDAIILFDGKDLSKWDFPGKRGKEPKPWKVENGYFEIVPGAGDAVTKEKFGDMQLHIEYMQLPGNTKLGQNRGNSGVLIMNRYEIQVLDSYGDPTYADGQAGAIYGQWPPMVNAIRKPGEWNAYDIVFEAPKFEGDKLVKPPFVTVLFNGVMVHNRQEITGPKAHRVNLQIKAHGAEEPLGLQDHNEFVRFRNIWARKLKGYDRK